MDQPPPGTNAGFPAPASSRPPGTVSNVQIGVFVTLIVIAVLVVVGASVYMVLSNGLFGGPSQGLPAPIRTGTAAVSLSAEQPLGHGRVSVGTPTRPTSELLFSVNAGLPRAMEPGPTAAGDRSIDPAAVLRGLIVRLRASAAGTEVGRCIAPCELRLPGLNCSTGNCALEIDWTLELVPNGSQPAPVTVDVTAAAAARLGESIPDTLQLELLVEDGQ